MWPLRCRRRLVEARNLDYNREPQVGSGLTRLWRRERRQPASCGSSSAVEHLLAKEGVASSNLVFSSSSQLGARLWFKIWAKLQLRGGGPCVRLLAASNTDPLII